MLRHALKIKKIEPKRTSFCSFYCLNEPFSWLEDKATSATPGFLKTAPELPLSEVPQRIQAAVILGILFDKNCGYRLGHGKGYFDQFPADKSLLKIGRRLIANWLTHCPWNLTRCRWICWSRNAAAMSSESWSNPSDCKMGRWQTGIHLEIESDKFDDTLICALDHKHIESPGYSGRCEFAFIRRAGGKLNGVWTSDGSPLMVLNGS